MLTRCENLNCKEFKYYGGRGIKVCERWHDFRNFFADMGPKPESFTLDRKDNNGNYEPMNCRWATWEVQRINRSHGKFKATNLKAVRQHWFVAFNLSGKQIVSNNQSEFARKYKVHASNVSRCLSGKLLQIKGWKFQWIIHIG